nr:uncharacterized protein LOC125623771 [Caretta caretta]XP_048679607.1 uncharacterized protein LOC125623771 [Caretta caretta]
MSAGQPSVQPGDCPGAARAGASACLSPRRGTGSDPTPSRPAGRALPPLSQPWLDPVMPTAGARHWGRGLHTRAWLGGGGEPLRPKCPRQAALQHPRCRHQPHAVGRAFPRPIPGHSLSPPHTSPGHGSVPADPAHARLTVLSVVHQTRPAGLSATANPKAQGVGYAPLTGTRSGMVREKPVPQPELPVTKQDPRRAAWLFRELWQCRGCKAEGPSPRPGNLPGALLLLTGQPAPDWAGLVGAGAVAQAAPHTLPGTRFPSAIIARRSLGPRSPRAASLPWGSLRSPGHVAREQGPGQPSLCALAWAYRPKSPPCHHRPPSFG